MEQSNMKNGFLVVIACALGLTADGHGAVGSAGQDTKGTIDRVLAEWAKRQEEVRTARFSWTEDQTFPKGSIHRPGRLKMLNPKGLTVPEQDTTFAVPCAVVLSGTKLRYSFEGRLWNDDTGLSSPQAYVSVFDGEVGKTYWAPGAIHYPRGVVKAESKHADQNNLHIRPLLLYARPRELGIDVRDSGALRLIADASSVEGVNCLLLEQSQNSTTDARHQYWVDPTRDYLVTRYASTDASGALGIQIDIAYTQAELGHWLPEHWKVVWMESPNQLKLSTTARVTMRQINPSVGNEEFSIDFPNGTFVTDASQPSELGKFTDYVIQSSGNKREVLASDLGATYEQLRDSQPGEALRRSSWHQRWWIGLSLGVFVLVVALLLWSRVRRSRGSVG
jgi:hypothetical protein